METEIRKEVVVKFRGCSSTTKDYEEALKVLEKLITKEFQWPSKNYSPRITYTPYGDVILSATDTQKGRSYGE